jgi:SAM-dependent methyltransferase
MEKLTPEIFNLAFSYRDFGNECDHFEYNWQKATESENHKILDVACGPGGHIEQFCARGYDCTGIDYDPAMIAFCTERFANTPYSVSLHQKDLVSFELEETYGLALNLLNTANDILTNKEFVTHLKSVGAALDTGGIYILEMAHPKEISQQGQVPTRTWEINRESQIINAELRYSQERFDPINQTRDCTLQVRVENGDQDKIYTDTRKNRIYLFQEFMALVELAGCFEFVTCYGTFNSAVMLNDERRAMRMIPVLRKK